MIKVEKETHRDETHNTVKETNTTKLRLFGIPIVVFVTSSISTLTENDSYD